jgi:hypothetical protein
LKVSLVLEKPRRFLILAVRSLVEVIDIGSPSPGLDFKVEAVLHLMVYVHLRKNFV